MKQIFSRQFRILQDTMAVYQFLAEIYERDWRNGVPAPFFEYAMSSTWMDTSYTYLNRLWFDGDKIVGFVFYENPVTDLYFCLRPGYEELAREMVTYADRHMPDFDNARQLILFGGQETLQKAAMNLGYRKVCENSDTQFDFSDKLEHPLPDGFHFVPDKELDVRKCAICTWKGFDHEHNFGPWADDQLYIAGTQWTPANCLKNHYQILQAPHQTCQYNVVIADEKEEYVCFAGMWYVAENQLAYMEPLCTIPEYRGKGLAAAALSEMYRRMKALGATHMTGGMNPFYRKIGFRDAVVWTNWVKA